MFYQAVIIVKDESGGHMMEGFGESAFDAISSVITEYNTTFQTEKTIDDIKLLKSELGSYVAYDFDPNGAVWEWVREDLQILGLLDGFWYPAGFVRPTPYRSPLLKPAPKLVDRNQMKEVDAEVSEEEPEKLATKSPAPAKLIPPKLEPPKKPDKK